MAKKPPKFVTREEARAKIAERGAQRQATIAENAALKEPQGGFAKGTDYSEGFDSSKEALSAYPNAASHDPGFHDAVRAHISELNRRINTIRLMDTSSEDAKKAGISQAVRNRVADAAPSLRVHLDAASNELARSFAAHQHGAEGGEQAYHTAHVAYLNAHKHITDAHRILAQSGLDQHIGNPAIGSTGRLLSTTARTNLANEYKTHLQSSALNKKVRLSKSVLSQETPDLSPAGEGMSDVGQQELRRRGMPGTAAEAADREAKKAAGAKAATVTSLKESAMRGKYTPTLQEVMRAKEGQKPSRTRSAYAGVGITGFNDIAQAAKAHFEANNPGQRWSESPHSQPLDLDKVAREHFESTNEGQKFTLRHPKKVIEYIQKNIPHVLQPEAHPTIQYALKHNLGVFKSPENVVGGTMRLMGESKLAGQAGQISRGRLTEDPTNVKSEQERITQKQAELESAPRTAQASKRNTAFQGGQVK